MIFIFQLYRTPPPSSFRAVFLHLWWLGQGLLAGVQGLLCVMHDHHLDSRGLPENALDLPVDARTLLEDHRCLLDDGRSLHKKTQSPHGDACRLHGDTRGLRDNARGLLEDI